ncbi:MAG: hypothetical protein AB1798_05865 [Spirochaetota bacterium]
MDRKLLKKIKRLAIDEDWRVRESAASEIKKINDEHFDEYLPDKALNILKILACDERRYVWRAAASSVIKILRKYPKKQREIQVWDCNSKVIETIQKYAN